MQFTTLALSALLSLASAQTVTVVSVASANNSLIFSPNNIKVAVGDMVQFQFLAGNHTVTQSTFDQPCEPIHNFNKNVTGFHSGFVPAAASINTGMIPTYTIQINNTTPIWIYCAQGKHCQAGMSMVINENTKANATRSLAEYQKLSLTAKTIVPSEESSGTTGSTTASGTASTTTTTSTSGASFLAGSKLAAGLVAVAGSLFLL